MNTLFALVAHNDGWGHMGHWGSTWTWLWGTLMVLALIAVIVRFFGLSNSATGPTRRHPNDRARQILAERYANGELSTEDYQERMSKLR